MRAARLASVVPFVTLVAATTACTVSDKFLAYDANPGDDTIDASTDPDGGVDTTPPETTLTSTPPADDDSGSATFEFEADEPATFKCSVDGESAVDCTSPYTRTLADGPHTFSVRAIDTSGNQDETPAEHTWNIDTVAPDTTIVQGPAAIDNSTDVEFTFSSNEANVTFECNLDGAGFSTCTTPASFTGLTDGNHTFQVRAKDAAGNVDASPAMHAWMIDTSTPDTTIDSGPLGAVSATDALFSFSSPDAGPGATFECALDGAAFAGCTSPKSYTSLTEATHMFQVRVRDAGGNVDPSPALRMWTVDRTPPNTSLTAPIITCRNAAWVVQSLTR